MIRSLNIIMLLSVFMLSTAQAATYTCTIKNTLKLNQNGSFVTHGWAANYQNREFTVDAVTGQVLRTTALKQRLTNFNKDTEPKLLDLGQDDKPLRALTHYAERGEYALLEIDDSGKYANADKKPFFYHTDVGLILTGTCME